MEKSTVTDIFAVVGLIVCWAIAIVVGIIVFLTIANIAIAFASTGIGAVILAFVAYRIWRKYKQQSE